MILVEKQPKSPDLSKYIDRYQLFIIKEPALIKTIPNAKVDCYLIKEGGFAQWDAESDSFIYNRSSGVLPATNRATILQIPSNLICLNIKFNLNILGSSLFSRLLTKWEEFNFNDLIPEKDQKSIFRTLREENPTIDIDKLDAVIAHSLSKQPIDEKIGKVVELMQGQITNKFRVIDLADSMNMSQKSTERWIRKHFDLTPKKLLQVIRFEHVSRQLKNHPDSELMDSLEAGYYDQSHFIKECQKITGYAPRDFFSKMKLPTNDIVFE